MSIELPTKVKKGLRHPRQVPPYVIGRISYYLGRSFPDSRFGPGYKHEEGFITYTEGEFSGGNPSRPEFCARIFEEATQIDRMLGATQYERSLEVGCGYGRLSGWIASNADEAAAIEPNEDVLEDAKKQYPDIDFRQALADDIPFPDDHFDLAVTWTVLGHIPPDSFGASVNEIKRVVSDDSTLLLCEKTSGDSGPAVWVRSAEHYESAFAPFDLQETAIRAGEPSFTYAETQEVMRLEGPRAEK